MSPFLAKPPPHTLLITLDAFSTLYTPRHPIPTQYLSVAKHHGLHLQVSPSDLAQSFRNAFKTHSAHSPNYGKASGLTPEKWWASVVRDTFEPLVRVGEVFPERLPDALFERFSSEVGYELYPDTLPFLRQMREWKRNPPRELRESKVVLGVLTNSDPRVVGVLRSLGLRVGEGGQQQQQQQHDMQNEMDLNFVLTSYESGHEKPSPAMFEKAERLASTVIRRQDQPSSDEDGLGDVVKVHIGDDLDQDFWGAKRAGRGWDAILLDRGGAEKQEKPPNKGVEHIITKLTDAPEALISCCKNHHAEADDFAGAGTMPVDS